MTHAGDVNAALENGCRETESDDIQNRKRENSDPKEVGIQKAGRKGGEQGTSSRKTGATHR